MEPTVEQITSAIEEYYNGGADAGLLLKILHGLNDKFGYIPQKSISFIAERLNMSNAEVYGFITFYKDFKFSLPAKHTIKVCLSESCHALGVKETTDYIKKNLGFDLRANSVKNDADAIYYSNDGKYSLEYIYCFGNCGAGPTVMIDDKIYGKMNIENLKNIIKAIEE